MDIHFFFEGTIREEAACALLATLLEQDPGFRTAFVERVGGSAGAVASRVRVGVERRLPGDRWIDVLLEAQDLVVIVEVKLRPWAIQAGQLTRYYRAAVERWPKRRVIAVYLAPERSWGFDEARLVRREARRLGRDDDAVALAWSQVRWLLRFASEPDAPFARTGMRALERVSREHRRISRPS